MEVLWPNILVNLVNNWELIFIRRNFLSPKLYFLQTGALTSTTSGDSSATTVTKKSTSSGESDKRMLRLKLSSHSSDNGVRNTLFYDFYLPKLGIWCCLNVVYNIHEMKGARASCIFYFQDPLYNYSPNSSGVSTKHKIERTGYRMRRNLHWNDLHDQLNSCLFCFQLCTFSFSLHLLKM